MGSTFSITHDKGLRVKTVKDHVCCLHVNFKQASMKLNT